MSGAGVPVGVTSDSYDADETASTHAGQDVASATSPVPETPCGQTTPVDVLWEGKGPHNDEGRAMLQLVHDIAPSSRLRSPPTSQTRRRLPTTSPHPPPRARRSVVDDAVYPDETHLIGRTDRDRDQRSPADGVVYLSAAGNQNVEVDGATSAASSRRRSVRRPVRPRSLRGLQ